MTGESTVRILFGGDFAPCRRYEPLIGTNGGKIFGNMRRFIAEADCTIVNLETPLCKKSPGAKKAGPLIRATPETARALSEAGVETVTLANNHIFDYGMEGLSQTLAALQTYGISHVGAGTDRNTAEAPLRKILKDRRISIFSFAEREFNLSDDEKAGAAILDPLLITPIIIRERVDADVIIVVIHGGNEYFRYPRPGLRKFCHFLIEIGVDAVIGHHPHVPGAYEIYRDKPIVYSLGNLIFDNELNPQHWDEGYMAELAFIFQSKSLMNVSVRLIPFRQSASQGGMKLMTGEECSTFLADVERMRDHLENHPDRWLAAWYEFAKKKEAQNLIDMFSPIRFRGFRHLMKYRFIRALVASQSRKLHRLNMLRCPSHHELLVASLESNHNALE